MEESKKSWTVYKVYLLIASLVGLIWTLISLGIALTSLGQKLIITDMEYLMGERSYELQQCKEPYYYGKTTVNDENRRPSEEQIKTCEQEKKEQVVLWRNAITKGSVFGWIIWAILLWILFITHYPRFKRENRA